MAQPARGHHRFVKFVLLIGEQDLTVKATDTVQYVDRIDRAADLYRTIGRVGRQRKCHAAIPVSNQPD